MIGCRVGWIALTVGIVGCTTHYVEPLSDKVILYLKQPAAEQVFLACSLDGFTHRPAHRTRNGLWAAAVEPNREFRYFYIVDGKVVVPPCQFREMDDWGGENCIYVPRL